MTVSEIAARYGTSHLLGFTLCLVTWLLLALLRAPFFLIARVLLAAQSGIDDRVTSTFSPRPRSTTADWRSTDV